LQRILAARAPQLPRHSYGGFLLPLRRQVFLQKKPNKAVAVASPRPQLRCLKGH
jgi:hypothetical protein